MVLVRLALVGLALATLTPAYAAEPRAEVTLPWNDFKTLYDKGQAPKDPPAVAPLRSFS